MKHQRLLLPLLFLSACFTVGPDYEEPESVADEMSSWNGQLEGAIDPAELDPAFMAEWWTALDDPVLTSLIERAAEANLDLKTAGAALRQARAQRTIAKAAGLPSVGTTGQAQSSGSGDVTSELFTLGLDANWELDLFGRIERGVEAADAELDAAEEARRDVLVSILAEVALNYVDLRTLQRRKDVAEEELQQQDESLRIIRLQDEAGSANPLDLDRAVANVETTRSKIPTFEQQIHQVRNRLAVLLGQTPGSLNSELDLAGSIPVPPIQVAVGVPAEVLRRRPDVRKAERTLAAETARVGVATAELYPTFSLGGTIGLQSGSTSDLFDAASRMFALGPRMQWNIFEGGAIRARIEIQSATQEQALLAYESTMLTALEDVDNAIVAFTKERMRYQSLLTASESAGRAASIALTRFEAGETDYLAVLDSQRTRLSAQDQLVQSEGTIVANLVRLYKGLGGGWDSEAAEETE